VEREPGAAQLEPPRTGPTTTIIETSTEEATVERILIVEDDFDTRCLFETVLRSAGFDVLTRADATDLLALMRDWRPETVLMDLSLPGHARGDGDRAFALRSGTAGRERRRRPVSGQADHARQAGGGPAHARAAQPPVVAVAALRSFLGAPRRRQPARKARKRTNKITS
jgi:CheY-like chemotaxis protein